jgi:hypothetical protein
VPLHLHLPFAVAPCDARLTCGGGHLQGGPKESLLLKAAQMKRDTPAESAAVVMVREEAEIMKNIEAKKALMSAKELAKGVEYTQRMETGYVATRCTVVCPLTCGPAQAHITLCVRAAAVQSTVIHTADSPSASGAFYPTSLRRLWTVLGLCR